MHSRTNAGTLTRWAFLLILLVFTSLSAIRANAGTTNMIAYADSKVTPAGKLVINTKGVRYRYKNGTFAQNTWIKVGGHYFCFDAKGYARPGWFEYSGNTYYATSKGSVFHQMWHKEGPKHFYLKANGVLARAQWVVTDGKVYIVDKNGVMITNKYFRVGSKYYYVNKNGQRVENAWVVLGGKRYFFNSDGERLSSTWIKYKGSYYYVKADGAMAVNQDVGKYHVGKNGVLDGYSADFKKYGTVDYLFVGDSRTVGLSLAVGKSDPKSAFIGKVGEGYTWMKNTADAQVKKYLKYNPTINVIFGFGVNDLGNVQNYINYYTSLIRSYPKAKIYILSVNPMVEAKWSNKYVSNKAIRDFNKKIYVSLKTYYINTFYYLCKNGYDTVDGLHYTADTYRKIFKYVKSQIK